MPAEEQTTPTTAASACYVLSPQGCGPLPFHLGVTVTRHQLPNSAQCWSGKCVGGGQAYMGGMKEELTLQGGSWKHRTKTMATKDDGGRANMAR